MEWTKDFYHQQLVWSIDSGADLHGLRDDLVDKMVRHKENKRTKVLELGGGPGQFAVAAAKRGYEVTVIDIAPAAVRHIEKLAEEHQVEQHIRVLEADFYKVVFRERFDVICYWDGFGIGKDADQQQLLQRIADWLKPSGVALIDIYTPWYWAATAGQEMQMGDISRHYGFDAEGSRMTDTWWQTGDKEESIKQSLRCYSPADLQLLMKDINLVLVDLEPGGAMDYEQGSYREQVPLGEAMMFMAKLKWG
ncbi:class I SAM-dependent methyltransferase [Lentibacillus sediminis]|uniref:class I SAM-dependent methyltransferase n=1 Tax=Lentibacillus sediminis TaxID=1940529 RepID=UPI000C1C2FBC|nr:class I SAM-dependent methyltransferase [Lentibacillus sediminis]